MFDIHKYMGKWYELAHYPSWFQRNDNYNTTAEYFIKEDSIVVVNSTITNGKVVKSVGHARQLDDFELRVDFEIPEVNNLKQSGEFNMNNVGINMDPNYANYVIDHIFIKDGKYYFAVVTDADKKSFYLLSRCPRPILSDYNEVMQYVVKNFNRDLLVQTPHY